MLKRLHQPLMDRLEAAVAHNDDVITGLCLPDDIVDNSVDIVVHIRGYRGMPRQVGEIPVDIFRLKQVYVVSLLQGIQQTLFMHPHTHGVGAWLEYGQDVAVTGNFLDRRQGLYNCGGMVCEIIVDGYAADFTEYFEAAFDAFELSERRTGLSNRHSGVLRSGNRGQGIQAVVCPVHGPVDLRGNLAIQADIKATAIFIA